MNTQYNPNEGETFEKWLDEQLTGGWSTGELETELRMAVSQIREMPKHLAKDYAVQPLKRFIEAYVTTRVKDAERLARIDELSLIIKDEKFIDSTHCMDCLGTIAVTDRLKILTATTNGKED